MIGLPSRARVDRDSSPVGRSDRSRDPGDPAQEPWDQPRHALSRWRVNFEPAPGRLVAGDVGRASSGWTPSSPIPIARTGIRIFCCGQRPFLIDHGAALYAHHDWCAWTMSARARHSPHQGHVLLHRAPTSPRRCARRGDAQRSCAARYPGSGPTTSSSTAVAGDFVTLTRARSLCALSLRRLAAPGTSWRGDRSA